MGPWRWWWEADAEPAVSEQPPFRLGSARGLAAPPAQPSQFSRKAAATRPSLCFGGACAQICAGGQNIDFLILTFLSTIVAVIGIITDSVAVVIAAMVIAPLLGPNLALSFGVTLGDRNLILRAVKTNCIGLGFTLVLAVLFGLFVPNSTYGDNVECCVFIVGDCVCCSLIGIILNNFTCYFHFKVPIMQEILFFQRLY